MELPRVTTSLVAMAAPFFFSGCDMQNHKNNIGLLRLVLASLVIIGHAPELVDGNRLREPLTRIFHSASLGDLSVDAFFLLSGYLVSQSMVNSGSVLEYLKRRVMRIYPAFLVSWLLCVYLLCPVTGGHPGSAGLRPLLRMALLWPPPDFDGQLGGVPFPTLNGSMWSIRFEFGCYLLIAVLGARGVLRRGFVAPVAAIVAVASAAPQFGISIGPESLHIALRMTAVFLMGSLFFLYRDAILPRLNWKIALLSSAVAILAIGDHRFVELGLMTFGAVGLFWLSFKAPLGWLQRVNDRWDISYGTYLYGWPVTSFILWQYRHISPWTLAAVALPVSMIAGAASWWGVEKWTKDLFKSPVRQHC